MKEIVLNECFGGFTLSKKAYELYREQSGKQKWDGDRCDPILIKVVKELGEDSSDSCSCLIIEEFDERYGYWIADYDGLETLHLTVREDILRELIKEGNEEVIVEYVMGAQA